MIFADIKLNYSVRIWNDLDGSVELTVYTFQRLIVHGIHDIVAKCTSSAQHVQCIIHSTSGH